MLDEALRAAHRPELAAEGQLLSPEQLRTLALNATAVITAAAAAEYQHYVRVREELRGSASAYSSMGSVTAAPASSAFHRSGSRAAATRHHAPGGLGHRLGAAVLGAGQPGGRRISDGIASRRWAGMSYSRRLRAALLGLHVRPEVPTAARAAGLRSPRPSEQPAAVRMPARTRTARSKTPAAETTEAAGAGGLAVFAVLAPTLSGTAAALFFLIGLILKTFEAEPALARALINAGWLAGAVAMVTIVVCAVLLLVTAVRSPGQPPGRPRTTTH
ncbi:hypothetical protein [Streptomyces sp. XD-27]|uniref:hypothetical protein n=1 Tax=Streptomyces sp. XD-27 TaxID=3062779 RepID=UPI0026F45EAF|nr:hypothetical protein [Streptomyces sp. XD-27]WKX74312.1 hypothetical protein Q3Y56_16520 [Streptomyces sp. XD-27]